MEGISCFGVKRHVEGNAGYGTYKPVKARFSALAFKQKSLKYFNRFPLAELERHVEEDAYEQPAVGTLPAPRALHPRV